MKEKIYQMIRESLIVAKHKYPNMQDKFVSPHFEVVGTNFVVKRILRSGCHYY